MVGTLAFVLLGFVPAGIYGIEHAADDSHNNISNFTRVKNSITHAEKSNGSSNSTQIFDVVNNRANLNRNNVVVSDDMPSRIGDDVVNNTANLLGHMPNHIRYYVEGSSFLELDLLGKTQRDLTDVESLLKSTVGKTEKKDTLENLEEKRNKQLGVAQSALNRKVLHCKNGHGTCGAYRRRLLKERKKLQELEEEVAEKKFKDKEEKLKDTAQSDENIEELRQRRLFEMAYPIEVFYSNEEMYLEDNPGNPVIPDLPEAFKMRNELFDTLKYDKNAMSTLDAADRTASDQKVTPAIFVRRFMKAIGLPDKGTERHGHRKALLRDLEEVVPYPRPKESTDNSEDVEVAKRKADDGLGKAFFWQNHKLKDFIGELDREEFRHIYESLGRRLLFTDDHDVGTTTSEFLARRKKGLKNSRAEKLLNDLENKSEKSPVVRRAHDEWYSLFGQTNDEELSPDSEPLEEQESEEESPSAAAIHPALGEGLPKFSSNSSSTWDHYVLILVVLIGEILMWILMCSNSSDMDQMIAVKGKGKRKGKGKGFQRLTGKGKGKTRGPTVGCSIEGNGIGGCSADHLGIEESMLEMGELVLGIDSSMLGVESLLEMQPLLDYDQEW